MQKTQVIDITKSYFPGDPNAFPENLIGTDREDGEEKTLPVVPFEGYNFLPTSYGYRSYFGASSQLVGDAAPANCDQIILFQKSDYSNMMIAFTAAGIYTRTGAATAWTQTFALTDTWTASQIYKEYSWIVLGNDLYMYRQGHTHVMKITDAGVASSFVPTFLNMAGQMGIFKAHGRIGFWDSLNSVSWSSALDYQDFTPSLETLAGNCIFLEVQGRIVTIKDHGEGYVIYSTKSITGIGYNTQGTQLWDAMALTQAGGIGYPKAVTVGENNKQHFAYTSIGIFMIGHFNALSRQYDMQQIAPELFDYLKESRDPVYLDVFGGRYLHFGMLDNRYLNGIVSFNESTAFVYQDYNILPFEGSIQPSIEGDFGTLTQSPLASITVGETSITVPHNSSILASAPPDIIPLYNFFFAGDWEISTSFSVNSAVPVGTPILVEPLYLESLSNLIDFVGVGEKTANGIKFNTGLAMTFVTTDISELVSVALPNEITGTVNIKARKTGQVITLLVNDSVVAIQTLPTYTYTVEPFTSIYFCYFFGNLAGQISEWYFLTFRKILSYPTDTAYIESLDTEDFNVTYTKNNTTFDYPKLADAFNLGTGITHNNEDSGYLLDTDPLDFGFWDAPSWTISWDLYIATPSNSAVNALILQDFTYQIGAGTGKIYIELRFDTSSGIDVDVILFVFTPESAVAKTQTVLTNASLTSVFDINKTWSLTKVGEDLTLSFGDTLIPLTGFSLPTSIYPLSGTFLPISSSFLRTEMNYPGIASDVARISIRNVLYSTGIIAQAFYQFPTPTFSLQSGSIAPAYPEILGSLVFDIQLKKWGKNLNSHRCLISFSPLNETQNQTIPFTNFGVDSGMLKFSDSTIRLFSPDVEDSVIKYGKIGFYRQGFSSVQEIVLHFRIPSTGSLAIEGSLDGKVLDSRLAFSETFERTVEHILYVDKSARWFNIAISGQFDLTYLEFRGTIAGRR